MGWLSQNCTRVGSHSTLYGLICACGQPSIKMHKPVNCVPKFHQRIKIVLIKINFSSVYLIYNLMHPNASIS